MFKQFLQKKTPLVEHIRKLEQVNKKISELEAIREQLGQLILHEFLNGKLECIHCPYKGEYGWDVGAYLFHNLEKDTHASLVEKSAWRHSESGRTYNLTIVKIKAETTLEYKTDNEFLYQHLLIRILPGYYILVAEWGSPKEDYVLKGHYACWVPKNGKIEILKDEKVLRRGRDV